MFKNEPFARQCLTEEDAPPTLKLRNNGTKSCDSNQPVLLSIKTNELHDDCSLSQGKKWLGIYLDKLDELLDWPLEWPELKSDLDLNGGYIEG